jgi:ATP-dependent Lon protease
MSINNNSDNDPLGSSDENPIRKSSRKRKMINYNEALDTETDEDYFYNMDIYKNIDSNDSLDSHDSRYDEDDIKNTRAIFNTKFIDEIIKTIPSPEPYIKRQGLSFYNNLIKNQPQLSVPEIYNHLDYYLKQSDKDRQKQLDEFYNIINLTANKAPKLFQIINSSLDTYHKKLALTKLQTLEQMKPSDNEYFKLSQWLDNFLDIPFNKFNTPKYLDTLIKSKPAQYLKFSQKHLDSVIFGQSATKNHIIEILGKMITNPRTMGSIFAIHGEPGTGKTTLIKEGLSKVFGLPFVFISLGGAQDRSFLAGSSYVYEGSCCGKIIQSLKQAQCMNPIFYFDELDKVSNTEKGQEIMNLLIHLTDYSQNGHFVDDYMDGISVDLSRATFVFSFNDIAKVSPILLDRMEIIRFKSYSIEDKEYIARNHILPSVVENIFGTGSRYTFTISDECLKKIVNPFDNDSGNNLIKRYKNNNKRMNGLNGKKLQGGVRYIKKKIEKKLSKINIKILNVKYNDTTNITIL